MFERYTEKARRVIFFARYEASQFGSPYIETEHLLLGLLREDKALTNRFLRSHASVESIRKQIEAHTPRREKTTTSVDLPLGNECKRVLAYAAEEAERLSHQHIGTAHLLLGLLREEKCFAAEILFERGLRLDDIRKEVAAAPHVESARPPIARQTPLPGEAGSGLAPSMMMRIFGNQKFLAVYSGVLTLAFALVVVLGTLRPVPNASFDQITVHRINVIEPDGTTRMVLSNRTQFPGSYYMGKEHPRTDRDATGILFNDDEGTENGGLIFGGKKDKNGLTHSWGHLSFDEYQRDQTLVLESVSDGDSRTTYYELNDDSTPWAITPEVSAEFQRVKAMAPSPERAAASRALHAKYPGGIVNRGYFGRGLDKSVSLSLKDQQGRERLVARVAPDGTPEIQFLDATGKVVRTISAETR